MAVRAFITGGQFREPATKVADQCPPHGGVHPPVDMQRTMFRLKKLEKWNERRRKPIFGCCLKQAACEYLLESSIFMRGFVKMGVTVCGDWGGVTAGEGMEGLSEVLPSASFPFSLYRGAPPEEWQGMQHNTCDGINRNQKGNKSKWRSQK